ncbi:Mono- and diacylglycerol lipase [Lachnellula occidentalis]|uniref:Mono-and diacylglycerol lipase n=1 Tax=Lachnellula occidentalis TaxID=215460 RepID=A0A8H8S2L4_9HELO|nr:Mono- and diacylglycerol lipase [Lachnellula occidentalis]
MQLQAVLVLGALVFQTNALPLQLTRDVLQPRDNTTNGITEALLDNFKLFANFTAASYCPSNENSTVGSLVSCAESACPLVEADIVTSVVEFGGENDTTVSDIKGYVALDPVRSLIVVAFAGSGNTIRNYLTDVTFVEIPYTDCNACWVHSGFATGWSERRSIVLAAVSTALLAYPSYSIVVTGHSIGAAVGTLAAAELRSLNHSVDTYTYGSPRVGNEAFADFVTSQTPAQGSNFRMTHVNDPVPQLPPTWIGYQHTSPEYWLSGGNATTELYGAEDVVVCEGVGNEGCNAGTGLVPIDGDAHTHYLGLIAACQGPVSL